MFDNECIITGRHALRLKELAVKNAEGKDYNSAKIYDRYVDVYENAAIWGLLYNRTAEKDTSIAEKATIFASVFSGERDTCVFLYRMVMLLGDSPERKNLTKEEKINRAFRWDSQSAELLEQNMNLFHSYVRGGIDQMYETFCEGLTSYNKTDYMERMNDALLKFNENLIKNDGDFVPQKRIEDDIDFTREIEEILKN